MRLGNVTEGLGTWRVRWSVVEVAIQSEEDWTHIDDLRDLPRMRGKVFPGVEDLLIERDETEESIFALDHEQCTKYGVLNSVTNLAHIGESLCRAASTPALIRLQSHEIILSSRHGAQDSSEGDPALLSKLRSSVGGYHGALGLAGRTPLQIRETARESAPCEGKKPGDGSREGVRVTV